MFLKRLFQRLFPVPFFAPRWRRVYCACLLCLFLIFLIWRVMLAIQVSSKLDGIRAAGYPITSSELNAFYKAVPANINAAFVMTQAFALMQQFPDKRSNDIINFEFIWETPHRDEKEALVRQYVEMNRAAMDKACEALKLPECRYPIDFKYYRDTTFPHLSSLKLLVRLFAISPHLQTNENAIRELTNSIFTTLGLAHTLDNEPVIISQLVRFSIISITLKELKWGLEHVKLSDNDLKSVDAALGGMPLDRMKIGFVGERVFSIPYFRLSFKECNYVGAEQKVNTTNAPILLKGSPWTVMSFSGFFERDLNYFLDCVATNISIIQLPARERLQLSNINEVLEAKGKADYYVLSTLFLSCFSKIAVRTTEIETSMQQARTAIAVERFRLARNRLPTSLDELVPQYLRSVPEDPFDGHPIRFKLLEKGYVIYSVGRDGVDDGGRGAPMRKEKQRNSSRSKAQETVDMIFKVER